jgi:hypothetical protein
MTAFRREARQKGASSERSQEDRSPLFQTLTGLTCDFQGINQTKRIKTKLVF